MALGDPLVLIADLETRVGARTVAQLADDNGDGQGLGVTMDRAIAVASDRARKLLATHLNGGLATMEALLAEDTDLHNAVVEMAIGWLGERRASHLDEKGQAPYTHWFKRGSMVLMNYADKLDRSEGLQDGNASSDIDGNIIVSPFATSLLFSPTTEDPCGGGGF